MQLEKITQNVIKLDFGPRVLPKPESVAWIVEGFQISGFNAEYALHTKEPFADMFHALYPVLGIAEWARLRQKLFETSDNGLEHWNTLTQEKKHFQDPHNAAIFETLPDLPLSFQNWVDDRGVSLSELHPFKLWAINGRTHAELALLANQIVDLDCSRREGVMARELAIDLFLMGNVSAFHISANSKADWLLELQRYRYPNLTKRDDDDHLRVAKAPWPQSIKAKLVRKGDQSGIEVKFTLSSEQDLDKVLFRLKEKQQDLCHHLWPK